jgi:hypothetical protein
MKMPAFTMSVACEFGDQLFDLKADPEQENNLVSVADCSGFNEKLRQALCEAGAPEEEYIRLGLN